MADFPPLTDGEAILWEGKPDTKLRFGMETLAIGIGAGALILACLGLATVVDRAETGTYWYFLGPGLVVGAAMVLAFPLIDSQRRKRTSYRLTTQRAFIGNATAVGYPIPPLDDLIYQSGTPPTIYFAKQPIQGKPRQFHHIGFERIADANDVFIMLRTQSQDIHG